MKISPYKFVAVSYKLYAGDSAEQDLVEETSEDQHFTFISGLGLTLDSFEKKLTGLAPGDSFDFTLFPDEAYGEYLDEKVLELPKNMFEIDGTFDEKRIVENAIVPMLDEDGNQLTGIVASVTGNSVVMDFNHPLAGDTLHFVGQVEEVREPSPEELEYARNPPEKCCGCDSSCDSCN
ncbi:MAG: FKBP-type peptidyl-prolyl cis-trans isomerase [Bacteroidales bacterium]|jgi:FKBP-type peptidyl-prolyl cis-trans isomerase SlyD|nr:FKBP-type peptidyl-prolyl cis-trans isomerase [Bacteroidales bacterium]